MRAEFDVIRDGYELLSHVDPKYMHLQRRAAKLVAKSVVGIKEPLALELGCGTGVTSEEIFKVVPHLHLYACDESAPMIIQAIERLKKVRDHYFPFCCDVLVGLDVAPRVDVVVSVLAIHNIEPGHRAKLYERMGTKLRNGVTFINVDKIGTDDSAENERLFAELVDTFSALQAMGRSDVYEVWREHELFHDKPRCFTHSEQQSLLRENGFVNIQVKRAGFYEIVTAQMGK